MKTNNSPFLRAIDSFIGENRIVSRKIASDIINYIRRNFGENAEDIMIDNYDAKALKAFLYACGLSKKQCFLLIGYIIDLVKGIAEPADDASFDPKNERVNTYLQRHPGGKKEKKWDNVNRHKREKVSSKEKRNKTWAILDHKAKLIRKEPLMFTDEGTPIATDNLFQEDCVIDLYSSDYVFPDGNTLRVSYHGNGTASVVVSTFYEPATFVQKPARTDHSLPRTAEEPLRISSKFMTEQLPPLQRPARQKEQVHFFNHNR